MMKGFMDTGTMVVCLKQEGTADWFRERLSTEVLIYATLSEHREDNE